MTPLNIRIYITRWCRDCSRIINLLKENGIELDVIDIDYNLEAESFVRQLNRGYRSVPTLVFPDGSLLVEPTQQDLLRKILDLSAISPNQQ